MALPQIQVFNMSTDGTNIKIAFYQKEAPGTDRPIIAWRTMSPHIGHRRYMDIPNNYAVLVKYLYLGSKLSTAQVPINGYQGAYQLSGTGKVRTLVQTGPGEQPNIVLVNSLPEVGEPVDVWITLDGSLVCPTYNGLLPGMNLSYMIQASPLYVAFVDESVTDGATITQESVAASEMIIADKQTVYITGSAAEGYKMKAVYG